MTVQAEGGSSDLGSATGLATRAMERIRAARKLALSSRARPWLVGVTALVFVMLAVGSFRALPDEGRTAQPALIAVLVLVTTPATLALNGLEYRFMGNALGHRVSFGHAMRVSLVASIANYLPAPGGIAVRTAALKRRGSTVRSAVSINAVAGLVWAGVTGLAAGGAMLTDTRLAGRATAAAALGAVVLVAAALWLRRQGAGWRGRFQQLLLIELCLVLLSGLRVWISLAALGQSTGIGAAIAISGSTVLAAALGIFPAGLGLREVLAGGIAATVGVPAAAAVAATAVERVASQVGMALTALVSGVRFSDLRGGGETGESGENAGVESAEPAVANGNGGHAGPPSMPAPAPRAGLVTPPEHQPPDTTRTRGM
jgi:uncharacterized membrane protein YbhN (UPF0104 family)